MIKHIVMWKLKDFAEGADRASNGTTDDGARHTTGSLFGDREVRGFGFRGVFLFHSSLFFKIYSCVNNCFLFIQ